MASIASSTKHDGFMEPSNRFLIPPGSYAPAVVWAPGSPDHVKQNLAEEEEQKKAGEVVRNTLKSIRNIRRSMKKLLRKMTSILRWEESERITISLLIL